MICYRHSNIITIIFIINVLYQQLLGFSPREKNYFTTTSLGRR